VTFIYTDMLLMSKIKYVIIILKWVTKVGHSEIAYVSVSPIFKQWPALAVCDRVAVMW